jgi:hypothetical protein
MTSGPNRNASPARSRLPHGPGRGGVALLARPGRPADVDALLDRAVAGLPRWRRARTRRELAGYVEDAVADLVGQGLDAGQAFELVCLRFGSPETVAAGFRSLPPPRWVRTVRGPAAPLSAAVLGLVLGLVLVSVAREHLPATDAPGTARVGVAPAVDEAAPAQIVARHVREVQRLEVAATDAAGTPGDHRVAARLGLPPSLSHVLEPSVPALTPAWLPPGYDESRGVLFLTTSATVQYFEHGTGERAGIVVEVLRPDLSTVFQVKERHVFPVQVGAQAGFYIDGEWEVRGPRDEQSAPAAWRTDRSHSLLFARDGLLVLVAGPADLHLEDLLRIARSLR